MHVLRSYQLRQSGAVLDAIDAGYNRVVWTAPGGTGKTVTFSELTRRFLEMGEKVLILVDAIELVEQAYERVSSQCGLGFDSIGVERSTLHLAATNRVVIAMIQTIRRPVRLKQIVEWRPDVVIVDEAHVGAAPGHKLVYAALGVYKGRCIQIGTTATLKRNDRTSLAALKPDNTPYMVEDKKTRQSVPADLDKSIYQKHCSDYGLLQAVMDGWLVEPRGRTIEGKIDLTKLKAARILKNPLSEPDFNIGELAKEVDREDVNDTIVSAWLQHAEGRPTIAYCCSVHHSEALAHKFNAAGIPSASVDGETPEDVRAKTLADLRGGAILVVCNYGVYGKGVDVPNVGCILVARPTKSWSLYVQWVYRGTRPLTGVLDDLQEGVPEERTLAIEASGKPYCIVLDLVGNSGKHNPCTLPVILDLPADLDLEGHGVLEAYQLLERHKAQQGKIVAEHPKTFTQLETRLKEVDILKSVKGRSKAKWRATGEGYLYTSVPPGYSARLMMLQNTGRIIVSRNGAELERKAWKVSIGIAELMARSETFIREVIQSEQETARREEANISRGTLQILTPRQRGVLYHAGFSDGGIDKLTPAQAHAIIHKCLLNYRNKQNAK